MRSGKREAGKIDVVVVADFWPLGIHGQLVYLKMMFELGTIVARWVGRMAAGVPWHAAGGPTKMAS